MMTFLKDAYKYLRYKSQFIEFFLYTRRFLFLLVGFCEVVLDC